MVGICGCRFVICCYCIAHSELPGYKSGGFKSVKIIAHGIRADIVKSFAAQEIDPSQRTNYNGGAQRRSW